METIVWITGATQGLGLGFARNVPYPNARIISLSRRPHPDYETVHFDLADPATWQSVDDHFASILSDFKGQRAIFIQNAYYPGSSGVTGEVDPELYRTALIANYAAPIAVAEAFIRAVRPGYESGLAMISSHGAVNAFEGYGVYASAKAGIEHWCRIVHAERAWRKAGPWVVGIRPGFIVTQTTLTEAQMDPQQVRIAPQLAHGVAHEALMPDDVAREIWASLPPPPESAILSFGDQPAGT